MQFTIEKSQLNQGLNKVSRLANARMPIPILNNILLNVQVDQLTLSVTDLELGIQTALPVEVRTEGSFTVPARLLTEFILASQEKTLEGDVSDKATLTLKGAQSQVKIRGLDASEFPTLPFIEGDPTLSVRATELKEAIDLVSFATAIDDTRPVLAGILVTAIDKELILAATDSYRLAEKRIKLHQPAKNPCSVIVPKRTLMELSRLLADEPGDISVFVGDNQIQFSYNQTRLVSRVIEGSYPQYINIVPKEYRTRVTANLPDCVAALKMSQLFAREAGNLISMTMVPGLGVTVESAASQKGEANNTFTAITEGEEIKMSFNVKYLLDALQVVKAENVFLELSGVDKPIMIRPANSPEYFSLVMPLKMD
jgi:DNA polymerase-3 subunit beta